MERTKPVSLKLDDAGLDEIAQSEGYVGYAYDDADPRRTPITAANAHTVEGTLTIGYGHTDGVKPGDTCTPTQARVWLRTDARDAVSLVHRHVDVPVTQGEFNAMTDLFFNIGPGHLKGSLGSADPGKNGIACLGKEDGRPSTLLEMLNKGDYGAAADCFTQWRMPGSRFEWGLLKRRIKFRLIFLGLPLARAMNAMPNAMPATNEARYALVLESERLAREELADRVVTTPAAPAAPAPAPAPAPAEEIPDGAVPIDADDAMVLNTPAPAPKPSAGAPISNAPAPRPPPPPAEPPEPPPWAIPKPVVPGPVSPVLPSLPADTPNVKRLEKSRRYWGLFIFHGGRFLMILGASTMGGHFATWFGTVYGAVVADPQLFETTINYLALGTGFVMDVCGGWLHKRGGARADSVLVAGNEPPHVTGG